MMDRTDRHFRVFLRRITRRTLLYTEMIPVGAVLHGDRDKALGFNPDEKPLALQLGGSDPDDLAACARVAEDWGYDEVNLNVGCPSSRVREGEFGVCLMGRPERVAEGVAAMRAATRLPVTVKHRIGFDDLDRYEDMHRFVEIVAAAGCDRFSVHARKAWLSGLSPKDNRNVPPLRYEDVYRLKRELPDLVIEINGGISSLDDVVGHLDHVDGVMVGRAAYDDPYFLAPVDRDLYGEDTAVPTRREVVLGLLPYVEACRSRDVYLKHVTRHVLGLVSGVRGAKAWRRHLSESAHKPGAGAEVLLDALAKVPDDVLDERPGEIGGSSGDRTLDRRIKSPLLYQLS